MTEIKLEQIARVCHEANRAWCAANGDLSQLSWDDAPDWARESTFAAVATAQGGASPAEQHQAWIDTRTADGWVYGEVKDVDAKTHPCLVPYDELPLEQRVKDSLFIGVVKALSPRPEHGKAWAVVVDDPDMSRSHGFVLEALTQGDALDEGVRRAILADRRGAGVGLPPDDGSLELTPEEREQQLRYAGATRSYAAAGELHE